MERYTWADMNPKNWPRKKHIALAIDLALGLACWYHWLPWLGLCYGILALFSAFFPITTKMADLDDGILILFSVSYHWCRNCGRILTVSVLNLHLNLHIPSPTKKQHNGPDGTVPGNPADPDR